MLRRRKLGIVVVLPLLGVFVGQQTATAGTAAGGRPYQEDQRIDGLTMQFGTDAFATHNALGIAVANGWGPTLQNSIGTSITSGSTSLVFEMLGLTDLTGTNASSLSIGVVNATPFVDSSNPTAYNGNSDLDWWYTPSPLDVDANGVPTTQMSGSIANKALTAGGTHMHFAPSLLGPGVFGMSSVQIAATVDSSSAPLKSTNNFPPGHLPSEKISPRLVSFASMSGGQLIGNVSAASLATTPLSAQIVQSCASYTTNNSWLDLLVSGCTAFGGLVTLVKATQPDQVDPTVPALGGGGPYQLIADPTSKQVNGCKDHNGVFVAYPTCLDVAAYSAYFTFTTDRVIVPPPPRIALTPASGPPGTALRVDGISFVAAQTVKVKYGTGIAGHPSVTLCSAAVQADGTFTCSGSVPTTLSGSTGPHTVTAKETPSTITAKASFTLTAK